MREIERLIQETREKAKQIEQTWEKQKTERIKELRAKKVEIEKELMILETSENVKNIDPSSITSKRGRIATSTPNVKPSTSAECSGIAANTPKIRLSTSAELTERATPRRRNRKTSTKPGWIQQEKKRKKWRFYNQRQKLREEGKDEEWTQRMKYKRERERRRKQTLKLDSSETNTTSDVEIISIEHESTEHETNKKDKRSQTEIARTQICTVRITRDRKMER